LAYLTYLRLVQGPKLELLSHASRTVYLRQNQKVKPSKLDYLYGVKCGLEYLLVHASCFYLSL
jgi:hypothetical protein